MNLPTKDEILKEAHEYAEDKTGRKEEDFAYWCPNHAVYGRNKDMECLPGCEIVSTVDSGSEYSQYVVMYLEDCISELIALTDDIHIEIEEIYER